MCLQPMKANAGHGKNSRHNQSQLKLIISITLLAVFLLTHYERYMSYLQCRLAYYLSTATEKCDCDTILADAGSSLPYDAATHRHAHPDDHYLPAMPASDDVCVYLDNTVYHTTLCNRLLEPFVARMERPPDFTDLLY